MEIAVSYSQNKKKVDAEEETPFELHHTIISHAYVACTDHRQPSDNNSQEKISDLFTTNQWLQIEQRRVGHLS